MRYILGLGCAALMLIAPMQLSADEPISITVRPTVAYVNSSARLQVLVARNDMNRQLMWEVDGPNYYRSSAMDLDGASSPRSYFFTLRHMPAGYFEVRASVRRADDSVVMDRGRIRVVGGPE